MNSSKEVIRLIKKLREQKKISLTEMARRVGTAKSTLSRYENETRDFPINDVGKYAEILGVTIEELLGVGITNLEPVTPRTMKIPVLGKIACGDPILADENIEEYIYRSPDNASKGTLFALVAKGDSMEPTIPDGAYVIIREQSACNSGDIVAVLVNGDEEATLKRLKRQGDTIMLLPENPKYEPYIVDHAHNARIIGKAISYEKRI